MSCRPAQSDELLKFKSSIRKANADALEGLIKSLAVFVAAKNVARASINDDIRMTNRKIRVARSLYLEKTGQLPVKEYRTHGFVRYRLQSLIHNQCTLPTKYEWFIISRRYNQAREFRLVLSLQRNASSARAMYGDHVRVIKRKLIACDSIPVSLILLRHGAKFSYVESLFPMGRGTVRKVSRSPGVLWVGRVMHGEE